jgi:hypothetical protein
VRMSFARPHAGIVKRDGSCNPPHARGISGIIGCLPKTGRFPPIEVERPGNRPTFEQQQFIETINEAGGLAFVAHSVEEEEKSIPL